MSTFDSRYETSNEIDPRELPYGQKDINAWFETMTDKMKCYILSGLEDQADNTIGKFDKAA